MDKKEFQLWKESLTDEEQQQDVTGFFNVIKRRSEFILDSSLPNSKVGSSNYLESYRHELYSVPYSQEYRPFLTKAAELLHKAEDLTSSHSLKRLLHSKGDAFLSNDYYESDIAWMELLISGSVRQLIMDAKVGPPSYEKGLAKDILSVVQKTHCKNCLVWAKSDVLARDVIKLSSDASVGYIVMKGPSTGFRTNLLRMKGAGVAGVYHPLIDEKLVRILLGRNKKVYAWTVDDVVSMQKMLNERVDAIVTSNPTLLQGLMQEIRTRCLEEGFSF